MWDVSMDSVVINSFPLAQGCPGCCLGVQRSGDPPGCLPQLLLGLL